MITLGVRSWIADMLCFVRRAHVTASGDAVCRQADPQVQLEPADPAGGSGRNSVWKETSPEQGPGGRAESAPARDRARRFWPQAAAPPAARASWGSGRGKPTRAPRARGGEPESLGPRQSEADPCEGPSFRRWRGGDLATAGTRAGLGGCSRPLWDQANSRRLL